MPFIAIGLLSVALLLGIVACLWRVPDPHHQYFLSMMGLLDADDSALMGEALFGYSEQRVGDAGTREAASEGSAGHKNQL